LFGEPVDGRIFRQEADSGAVLQIGIRRFPDLRRKVDVHKKRTTGVVGLDADPEMALVETAVAVPEGPSIVGGFADVSGKDRRLARKVSFT
jgi:hypothetical protein